MSVYEEIKSNVTMPQVLSRYGIEAKRGFAVCPFHNEKTASMKVYPDGFYCFGCGAGGDVISFVAKIEGICNAQAAVRLASEFGISDSPADLPKRRAMQKKRQEEQRCLEEARRDYDDKCAEFRALNRYLPTATGFERSRVTARLEYLEHYFETTTRG